jgi:hypothetical protein
MAQLFKPTTNIFARWSIVGGGLLVFGGLFLLNQFFRSDYMTLANVVREQPVPFSHEHHVSGLGIDCRYCHTSVEFAPSAGIPPTETCMSCHSQIWTNAAILEPVRSSYKTGTPLKWNRVHDLPDFVYFNHSIHINKGIGCESCHGRVDKMPLMRAGSSLQMSWCLDCHRDPAKYIRPKEEVFTMGYEPAEDQATLGPKLVKAYHVNVRQLTNCSICHR